MKDGIDRGPRGQQLEPREDGSNFGAGGAASASPVTRELRVRAHLSPPGVMLERVGGGSGSVHERAWGKVASFVESSGLCLLQLSQTITLTLLIDSPAPSCQLCSTEVNSSA